MCGSDEVELDDARGLELMRDSVCRGGRRRFGLGGAGGDSGDAVNCLKSVMVAGTLIVDLIIY